MRIGSQATFIIIFHQQSRVESVVLLLQCDIFTLQFVALLIPPGDLHELGPLRLTLLPSGQQYRNNVAHLSVRLLYERPSFTENAYISSSFGSCLCPQYSESTDFALILLHVFCGTGNCSTRVGKKVPQIPLIKLWLPNRMFFQFISSFFVTCLFSLVDLFAQKQTIITDQVQSYYRRFCSRMDQILSISYRMKIPNCSHIHLPKLKLYFCPACPTWKSRQGKLGRSRVSV